MSTSGGSVVSWWVDVAAGALVVVGSAAAGAGLLGAGVTGEVCQKLYGRYGNKVQVSRAYRPRLRELGGRSAR